MLVIAIMVAAVAIALPVMRGAFEDQRLRKGAEIVQTEFARARNQAIKTGKVQVFQHGVFSDRFATTEQSSLEDALLSSTADDNSSQAAYSQPGAAPGLPMRTLPEGVYFVGADVRVDQRTSVELSSFEMSPALEDVGSTAASREATRDVSWGMPIFFFPDGTTSTATLTVANDRQQAIEITLRGLTGLARVGNPQVIDTLNAAGRSAAARANP